MLWSAAAVGLVARHPALARLGAATVTYVVVLVAYFHGIVLHPGTTIADTFGDGTASLRDYWAAAAQHRNPFDFMHDALNGAPEGMPRTPATEVANGGLQSLFLWALQGPLGLIGAWNTFLLAGLFGTALVMFSFLQRIGCSLGAALIGGFVFAFSPYAFERADAGHLGLLQNWIFPLLALLLLRLHERLSFSLAAGAGLAIALAFYLSAYQGLFAAFMALVFLLLELARPPAGRTWRATLAHGGLAAFVGLAALTPVLVLYADERSAVDASVNHASNQIVEYSATLSGYLLPSPHNTLFGAIHNPSRNLTEDTLFFGYSTLLLALAGIVLLIRREGWIEASPTRRRAALFAGLLAPAAFLASLPPTYQLGPVTVPMPSDALEHLTTFWRDYSRFGLLVGFALAILAALALTTLGRRSQRWRALTPLVAVLVVLELFQGNVPMLNATALPPWVRWLASHPRGIVATYPWLYGSQLARDDWYQVYDRDPQFAAPNQPGRAGGVHLLARDLGSPIAASVLAGEGVRYVVLHEGPYHGPIPDPRHFDLLASFGTVKIYSVHAAKVNIDLALRANAPLLAELQSIGPPSVTYMGGFNGAEQYQGLTSRWMIQDGHVALDAAQPTDIILHCLAFANHKTRLLELQDSSGRVLGRAEVRVDATLVDFGPLLIPTGTTTLTLVAFPGAAPLGSPDPRFASVFFVGGLQPVAIPTYVERAERT